MFLPRVLCRFSMVLLKYSCWNWNQLSHKVPQSRPGEVLMMVKSDQGDWNLRVLDSPAQEGCLVPTWCQLGALHWCCTSLFLYVFVICHLFAVVLGSIWQSLSQIRILKYYLSTSYLNSHTQKKLQRQVDHYLTSLKSANQQLVNLPYIKHQKLSEKLNFFRFWTFLKLSFN